MDLRNKKAFTVAEMLIVLFIMSIITIAFIPVITQKTKNDAAAAVSGAKSVWQHVTNSGDIYFSTASNAAGAIIGANSYADVTRAKIVLNTKDATQYQMLFKQGTVPVEVGHLTVDGSQNIGLGKTAVTGSGSTAIGVGTINGVTGSSALGGNATALGAGTIANGSLATAIGSGAAAGPSSTALGGGTVAGGTYSTTIGVSARALGNFSTTVGSIATSDVGGTAVGYKAVANGSNSTSIGSESSAAGASSIAIGYSNLANTANSVAIGGNPSGSVQTTADNQIMLGSLSGSVRIKGDLYVHTGNFIFGADTEKLSSVFSSGLDFLYLNSSDRKLKNINGEFDYGLGKIGELQPYNYTFKKDKGKTPHVGVMAQDLQKVFPHAVIKDKQGNLMIRQEDMFFAMLNSIKQLDIIVKNMVRDFRTITERFMEIDTKTIALAQVDKINDKRIKNIKSEDKSIEIRLKKIEKKLKSTK